MADHLRGPTSFWTQTGALFRKNLIIEKRNIGRIIWILFQGILWSSVLLASQIVFDKMQSSNLPHCNDPNASNKDIRCPNPSPPEWPPLLQLPNPAYAAVKSDIFPFTDLPNESCRQMASCPLTVLVTGNDQSVGQMLSGNMFPSSPSVNLSDKVLGSSNSPDEFARPNYSVQRQCLDNSTFSAGTDGNNYLKCVQGIPLWRDSASTIDDELFRGHLKGNSERKINEIVAAYDLLKSDRSNFHVSIWYNKSFINPSSIMLRVARSVNLVSNAYLQYLQGPGTEMEFEFVKEMPKSGVEYGEFSLWASPIFISAIILQLFPLALKMLVIERQQKLRIMMKMHGLGDGPYWMISYAYFLVICMIYVVFIVTFCSVGGLRFFRMNDYLIQFMFFFIYINLQISVSFLVATFFSDLKTAAVMTPLFIAGTVILGKFLFESYLTNPLVPRTMVLAMELYPGFALYRGLYEFGFYAALGKSVGTEGMRWSDLSDSANGMREIFVIMIVEWVIALYIGYHIDSRKNPLKFLKNFRKKPLQSSQNHSQRQGSDVLVQMEKPDVSQEREKVEQLLLEPNNNHSLISDNLKKVYPGKDGNPDNIAVKGLSLALPRAECFGMLGPNGAGKTSFISMMIGLTKPTSGTAFVQGLDLRTQMDEIHTSMGVCPQHDLLWGNLTGREHLLFYGRLKNLKGSALTQAVEESLKSVNLFYGGVADKQAKKYSGGMKRRLSVAISLIGDPKIVYMDEPSSGLDPASRNHLWNVVKKAKKDRAIFLTTHSMEEAEALCDRLGIFVDGSLQCIGNPSELKARYGGSYVFTMTTSSEHEEDVENLARHLSPSASKIYHISGTQKFELPKNEVKISNVFEAVENAKRRFTVSAWGLADTTLEDVFLKVAGQAQSINSFS